MPPRVTCTKRYDELPFAHRQPLHEGHCRFVHGHNWSFEFEFAANSRDAKGFVIDFGGLRWLKAWLEEMFDHTILINEDDPLLDYFQADEVGSGWGIYDLRVVADCSCEGLALLAFNEVSRMLVERTAHGKRPEGEVWISRVTLYEDSRNSATVRGK